MTPAPVAIDFETRSTVDLPRHGGHRYAESPDSDVLCLVARLAPTPGGSCPTYWAWTPLAVPFTAYWPEPLADVDVTYGTDAPPESFFAACRARGVVAHNAEGFDRLVWEALGWPEVTWYDSAPRARRVALPGSLDGLGRALGIGVKDEAGAASMRLFSQPQKIGTGAIDALLKSLRALRKGISPRGGVPVRLLRALLPGVPIADPVVWREEFAALLDAPPYGATVFLDPDPSQLGAIVRYCAQDVYLLAEAWEQAHLGKPHPDDAVLDLDVVVNRRGVAVDLDLVGRLLAEAEGLAASTVARAALASKGAVTETTLNSPSALCAWLRKRGYLVPNAQERAIRAARDAARSTTGRNDPDVAEVCDARLTLARVSVGKLRAIQDRVCADGRLRGMFSYYGAHTGRWAGRGVQPQNLPRPADGVDETIADRLVAGESLADLATEVDEVAPVVIGSLIRSCLVASPGKLLARVDLSAIEARGLLWLAGDDEGLARYAADVDAYKTLAASIYGVDYNDVTKAQRQAGKVGVLACGYAGGPRAVEKMALKGGIDLAAAGTTPAQVVEGWRSANPLIAGAIVSGRTWTDDAGETRLVRRGGLWRELERDAKAAVTCTRGAAYGLFHRDGLDLICTLPSGRPIVYREARVEDVERGGKLRQAITYLDAVKGRRVLHGGIASENVTQAICRDVMASGLLRCEAAGFRVVMHVHDEAVVEIDTEAQVDAVVACMETVPEWAAGWPIKAVGEVGRRYGK